MELESKQNEMDNSSKKSEENSKSNENDILHQFPFLNTRFTKRIVFRKNKQRKNPLYTDKEKKKEYRKMFPRVICRLESKKLLSCKGN